MTHEQTQQTLQGVGSLFLINLIFKKKKKQINQKHIANFHPNISAPGYCDTPNVLLDDIIKLIFEPQHLFPKYKPQSALTTPSF